MKGAKVITRFSIFSKTENKVFFDNLTNKLSQFDFIVNLKDDYRILKSGKKSKQKNVISCAVTKKYFDNIISIETCGHEFMSDWKEYERYFSKLQLSASIKLVLDFEITVSDFDMPSLVFSKDFISFLADIGCELSMNMYEK